MSLIRFHHDSILFATTILLSICANTYTNGLIGPDTQHETGYKVIRYCLLIFTIFIAFGFSDVSIHPVTQLVNTVIVCVLFIVVSSLSHWYFYICFVMIGITLILESFRHYYRNETYLSCTFMLIQYILAFTTLTVCMVGIIRERILSSTTMNVSVGDT